ncbi:MAG: helix-turn-helix domain-containing protein [Candidatus Woykebacteria bacterium]
MSSLGKDFCKCSSAELRILGDFWTLEVLQTLVDGGKRFSELERALPDINPTTLTKRLKKLENEKLIVKKRETVDKLSVVYFLSEKGQDTIPVLSQIKAFADKHL